LTVALVTLEQVVVCPVPLVVVPTVQVITVGPLTVRMGQVVVVKELPDAAAAAVQLATSVGPVEIGVGQVRVK
jgi:hypothetical protein